MRSLSIKVDPWLKKQELITSFSFCFSNVKELTKDHCGCNGWSLEIKIIVK